MGYPCLTTKLRDLCLVCVTGFTVFEEVLCRIWASCGRAESRFQGCAEPQGPAGLVLGNFPHVLGVSERTVVINVETSSSKAI